MDEDEEIALVVAILVFSLTIGCTIYIIYDFCKNIPHADELESIV
jgi:hypothetical protein